MEEYINKNRFIEDIKNFSAVKDLTLANLKKTEELREKEIKTIEYIKDFLLKIPAYNLRIADVIKEEEKFYNSPLEESKYFSPYEVSLEMKKKLARLAQIRREKGRGFKNNETEEITKEYELSIALHKENELKRIKEMFLERKRVILSELVYQPPSDYEEKVYFDSVSECEEFLVNKEKLIQGELLISNNQKEAYEKILNILNESLERLTTIFHRINNIKGR